MIYTDRLKSRKLPTLHYRTIRGEMIEICKIGSGKYDSLAAPMLPRPDSYVTRGHDLRLQQELSYRKQIAHQLRTQFVEGITVTLKSTLRVTQGHWKWHHLIDRIRVPIRLPE